MLNFADKQFRGNTRLYVPLVINKILIKRDGSSHARQESHELPAYIQGVS